jgi:hypothetical protein
MLGGRHVWNTGILERLQTVQFVPFLPRHSSWVVPKWRLRARPCLSPLTRWTRSRRPSYSPEPGDSARQDGQVRKGKSRWLAQKQQHHVSEHSHSRWHWSSHAGRPCSTRWRLQRQQAFRKYASCSSAGSSVGWSPARAAAAARERGTATFWAGMDSFAEGATGCLMGLHGPLAAGNGVLWSPPHQVAHAVPAVRAPLVPHPEEHLQFLCLPRRTHPQV